MPTIPRRPTDRLDPSRPRRSRVYVHVYVRYFIHRVHRTVYFNHDRGVAAITAIGDARAAVRSRDRASALLCMAPIACYIREISRIQYIAAKRSAEHARSRARRETIGRPRREKEGLRAPRARRARAVARIPRRRAEGDRERARRRGARTPREHRARPRIPRRFVACTRIHSFIHSFIHSSIRDAFGGDSRAWARDGGSGRRCGRARR